MHTPMRVQRPSRHALLTQHPCGHTCNTRYRRACNPFCVNARIPLVVKRARSPHVGAHAGPCRRTHSAPSLRACATHLRWRATSAAPLLACTELPCTRNSNPMCTSIPMCTTYGRFAYEFCLKQNFFRNNHESDVKEGKPSMPFNGKFLAQKNTLFSYLKLEAYFERPR